MSHAYDPATGDAERLLANLAGVVSAHVVRDATGKIVEIHILSAPDLHPKQMVRNVESALSAGLGVQIDRRVVSVAQIRSDLETNGHRVGTSEAPRVNGLSTPDGSPSPTRDPDATRADERLEYVRYESRRTVEGCTCSVTLSDGRREIRGSATGPDTEAGRAEAAARAVFQAIGEARPEVRMALEAAVVSSQRGKRYVIVSAHAVMDRAPAPLAGAAVLTRSPEEAAILASLQATNRWNA